MTPQKAELINELKNKISELNKVITKFNEDKENTFVVTIYQQRWSPELDARSVKYAIKYVACNISETFIY